MWIHDVMMLVEAAFRELAAGIENQLCFGAGPSPKASCCIHRCQVPKLAAPSFFPHTAAFAPSLTPGDGRAATTGVVLLDTLLENHGKRHQEKIIES